jgi:hypothetical protein
MLEQVDIASLMRALHALKRSGRPETHQHIQIPELLADVPVADRNAIVEFLSPRVISQANNATPRKLT